MTSVTPQFTTGCYFGYHGEHEGSLSLHSTTFIACSGEGRLCLVWGLHCGTRSGLSKAESHKSSYTPVPGLLLMRWLWQCTYLTLAHRIVPKVLKNISGCKQSLLRVPPKSLLRLPKSTLMNTLCTQC